MTGWLVLGAGLSVGTVLGLLVIVAGFGLVERQILRYEVRRLRRWHAQRREPTQARVDSWPSDD
jgi:hypothetical protein